MGFSALVAAAVVGGSMLYGASEQRKARKAEEKQTDLARQELEAVQRQVSAEDAATPMPDPKDQKRAKRRSIAEQMRRRGRSSTMLTGDSTVGDPLG
jgi:cation transport ATPase